MKILYCKNCNKKLTKIQVYKKGQFCCKGCATSFRQKANDPNISKLKDKDLLYYILGLIWSDGNLNKEEDKISLTLKDLDLIESLYPIFSDINKRKIYKYKHKNKFMSYTLINTNCDFINFCKKKGLIPNKSFSIDVNNIPKKYFYAFVRGVFDGDGSVYIQNRYKNFIYLGVTIVSANCSFLKKLTLDFEKNHIEYNIYLDSRKSLYYLKIGKKQSIKNFYKYIYI